MVVDIKICYMLVLWTDYFVDHRRLVHLQFLVRSQFNENCLNTDTPSTITLSESSSILRQIYIPGRWCEAAQNVRKRSHKTHFAATRT